MSAVPKSTAVLDPLLSVDEMAAYLHTTPAAVRKRWQRGQLPAAVKVGKEMLWFLSDVQAHLRAEMTPPPTPPERIRPPTPKRLPGPKS